MACAVVERLFLLSKIDLTRELLSPQELVRLGYCDPVRLFVKQEPHPLRKIREGRYRLISSVSLVDQLVERMIFGPQNQKEIQMWDRIPSKPGMGLAESTQAQAIWRELEFKHSLRAAAEADISGFDWSVQSWELWADVYMRSKLGSFGPKLKSAAWNRTYCMMNSVFQLSDGTLISQDTPGLMKSGSYNTSSTNSRIRCLMAELIGSPWCIAMGDDSVEGYVDGARELYRALGHECKDYIPCPVKPDGSLESVNFCSHFLAKDKFWLTSWPKTLFRYLSGEHESLRELEAELAHSPMWHRIYKYVCAGRPADKTTKPDGTPQVNNTSNVSELVQTRRWSPPPTEVYVDGWRCDRCYVGLVSFETRACSCCGQPCGWSP